MQNIFRKKFVILILSIFILVGVWFLISLQLRNSIIQSYQQLQSTVITDRNDEIISIEKNPKGFYSTYSYEIPKELTEAIILKEDNTFQYHLGINPWSIFRSVIQRIFNGNTASSTITQQLVKILLNHEKERNLKNKLQEFIFTTSLEMTTPKSEILEMYLNSVYFGNEVQGIEMASRLYFDASPSALSPLQIAQLASTIHSPSNNHPFNSQQELNPKLMKYFHLDENTIRTGVSPYALIKDKFKEFSHSDLTFEIQDAIDMPSCSTGVSHTPSKWHTPKKMPIKLSIDKNLSETIRKISQETIDPLIEKGAKNTAIIILKEPENEIIAMIGSPHPTSMESGYQINMLTEPRPIGSTIKPLLYTKGFEKGLRPYTLVDDREYKYEVANGYAFYPKNYDYQYRGIVDLHEALSNSLNVPSVKVLEYIGINNFNQFLTETLSFQSLQNIESYQLGIALGGLEMNLPTLANYLSIFANQGTFRPLRIGTNCPLNLPLETSLANTKKIFDPALIEMTNTILSDRKTGIDQFGPVGSLNLPYSNYAVKTGTSRDYHDSWTIGYTPDFLVGVWVGNTENISMDHISGQEGAGKIWNQVMNVMYNSQHNKNTPFTKSHLENFTFEDSIEIGLKNDTIENHRNLLLENILILSPHNQDIFRIGEHTNIPLKASEEVDWFINEKFFAKGGEVFFVPKQAGIFEIEARTNEKEENLKIEIQEK